MVKHSYVLFCMAGCVQFCVVVGGFMWSYMVVHGCAWL